MKAKISKEIEFFFKNMFFTQKFLLKRRLKRAIKNNYEEELSLLDQIVNKNYECIDVGVYRGVYSYKLSKICNYVHSFEPNPLIFSYLNKNLKKIIKNMTLYNIALSNQEIITDLRIPKRFETANKKNYEERYKLGAATINKNNLLNNNDFIRIKVKTKKLDSIDLKKNISFIKIDVEGHEKMVIEGAINLIKKNKPNILVEIEERHTKHKIEDTINFINQLGYKSYFYRNKNLISTKKINDFKSVNNFIFLN